MLNSFLLCWASRSGPATLVIMAHKFKEFGLMMRIPVLFLSAGFLEMCGIRVVGNLFRDVLRKELFKRRPPNVATQWEKKKKRRLRISRLNRALRLLMALPTISVSSQELLRSDLAAFVGAHGTVDTTRLPDGVKGHLRAELAYNAPELEGVPGLKTAVADTGASSWCTADKSSILNYQELTRKV